MAVILQSLIIIILIILIYLIYNFYINLWTNEKQKSTFIKIYNLFDFPSVHIYNNSIYVKWSKTCFNNTMYYDYLNQIILYNKPVKSLSIIVPLELFQGYKNVIFSQKAIYNKLAQITKVYKGVSYNTFNETSSFACNSWEKCLAISVLLQKISSSCICIDNVIKNNLINEYKHNILQNNNEYFNLL